MRTILKLTKRCADGLAAVMLVVSGAAIIAIAVLGAGDTLGTQLLGIGIPSAIEMQEALAAVAIVGPMAAVQMGRENIVVDLFVDNFGPTMKRLSLILSGICGALAFYLLTDGAWLLAERSIRANELSHGLVDFPIYPFKIAFFLGFAAAFLQFVVSLAEAVLSDAAARGAGEDGAIT